MADRVDPEAPVRQPAGPRRAAAPAATPRWTLRRILLVTLGPAVVIVLGALGWTAWQVWELGSPLLQLRDVAGQARQHVEAGDLAALSGDLDSARALAVRADAAAHSAGVGFAAGLPWFGDDVTVARELAGVAADLSKATTGVDPLLAQLASGTESPLLVAAGALDIVEPIRGAADAAAARLSRLELGGLAFPVADDIHSLQGALSKLSPAVETLSPYLDALSILASPGQEHTWFVVMQNLGESRPSGGMLGSWLLLRSSDGQLRVLDQGANGDLKNTYDYAGFLPAGYEQVFGDSMKDWRSLNLSANFPDNARLFAHAWNTDAKVKADGVLALGQGSVHFLAAAAGPVEVDGRTIAPADLAGYLTVGVYQDYPDQDDKDAAVAEIVAQLFGTLSGGQFDLPGLVAAAVDGPGADHLQLWSADETTQRQVEAAGLSGEFADDPGPIASVRLANAAANKLDAFLHLGAEYQLGACVTDDGGVSTRSSTLTVTLRNAVPDGLTEYITGNGDLLDGLKHPVGATRDFVMVHTPVQATVTSAEVDGRPAVVQSAWIGARQLLVFDVKLDPGSSATIVLRWDELPTDSEDKPFPVTPRIVLPPLANAAEISVVDGSLCG